MRYSRVHCVFVTYLFFTSFRIKCITGKHGTSSSDKPSNFVRLIVCPTEKLLALNDWKFSQPTICNVLPCRQQRNGFIGNVYGVSFSILQPEKMYDVKLVAVADNVLANILDLDPNNVLASPNFVGFVSGNVLKSSTPTAHRYGGHQFGSWAGQLGDGRAVLLGEYINRLGERWELQLKGSGRTPYSRHGDGRAVLRSSVREFLASEAMHYLGVPTSRAASLVVSEDKVWRDQFYDGHPKQERAAVILRLAQSWFRIGSLEILTMNDEFDLLRRTVDFIIDQHFPDLNSHEEKYEEFFAQVVHDTAEMIVKWQSVGFTHGVCNTDNFSLLSITIDYGPYGFMDAYDPEFVPNTSDDEGRYSYRKQPDVGYFNMNKLRIALAPLIDEKRSLEILTNYPKIFKQKYHQEFGRKLGLIGQKTDDVMLIEELLKMMSETKADFTMTFRILSELTLDEQKAPESVSKHWALADLSVHHKWREWLKHYHRRMFYNGENDNDMRRQKRMKKLNPRYILRNWMAEKAIKMAEVDNFSQVQNLMKTLENPFVKQVSAELTGYASRPPSWASKLRVSCSS